MNNIIDGKRVALEIRAEFIKEIEKFDRKPTLVVISVGDDPASKVYIRAKEKASLEVGINFEGVNFPSNVTQERLIEFIETLNKQETVDGIIVQLPLPEHISKKVLNVIDPTKDVDGLTNFNIGCMVNDNNRMIPCTPLGIMQLLKVYDVSLEGKNVTVIGKSHLVGKPISNLLISKNATVTVCNSKTKNLKNHTVNADIIISAAGVVNLVTEDMVKDGVIIIDVGINKVDKKLCGDVDFENVKNKAKLITPVPGGVGPMTVAMLLNNTIKSYKNRK